MADIPCKDGKRYKIQIMGESFYLIVGEDFVDITVPFENRMENARMREIVETVCKEITKAMRGQAMDRKVVTSR